MSFPSNAVVGMLHFLPSLQKMFVYTGSVWAPVMAAADWFLFIDDERMPEDAGWHSGPITIARSSAEALKLVEESPKLPQQISFDHDLGGDDTAFKFMWRLIYGHLDGKWNLADVQAIQVHSANEVGAQKLISLWENFCRTQNINSPVTRVWPKAQ